MCIRDRDEPFDGLDPVAKDEIISLLNKLNNKYKTAMVITTHDVNIVPQIADIIYVINEGKDVYKRQKLEVYGYCPDCQ